MHTSPGTTPSADGYPTLDWMIFRLSSQCSIRTSAPHFVPSQEAPAYTAPHSVLPGVFKFVLDHRRHGWTILKSTTTVPIVPPRHDGDPRFLSAAWPYYVGAISTRLCAPSYQCHTPQLTLHTLSRAPSDAHGGTAGSHSKSRTAARSPGTYDGRETDAWALAVVLFALATRSLPFDSPPPPIDVEAERARRKWVLRLLRGWREVVQNPFLSHDAFSEQVVLRKR
jgi:hypothetical protein